MKSEKQSSKKFNFFRYIFVDIPKKLFNKKTIIIKSIIFIACFCLVFIPSINLWTKVSAGYHHDFGTYDIWMRENIFTEHYVFWRNFANSNQNWLIFFRIGVILFGILMTAFLWFFIDNYVLFGFCSIWFFAVMFNWVDGMIDGRVLDYLGFKSGCWWGRILIWPKPFDKDTVPREVASRYNVPDMFLFAGYKLIIGYTIYHVIRRSIQLILKYQIKNHKNKKISQNYNKQ